MERYTYMDITQRLMDCFPDSFINQRDEFIAHSDSNQYFILHDCTTEFDVKCKVLEWLSRAAFKTEPYSSDRENRIFHGFMLVGINTFLGTRFTDDDMEIIYTFLGNAVNHAKTVRFVESGYNMAVLEEEAQREEGQDGTK